MNSDDKYKIAMQINSLSNKYWDIYDYASEEDLAEIRRQIDELEKKT